MLQKLIYVIVGVSFIIGCNSSEKEPMVRSYRMGFQNSAPRFGDVEMGIRALNMWTTRADAALISQELPWAELLAGITPDEYILANHKPLVDLYRSKGLALWIYIDPQNGLNRGSDAQALVDAGRSMTEPAMQVLFRKYVVAMDSILKPDHLGLALETNLMRAASTASLYSGIKTAVNDAATAVRARNTMVKLSVSVQVDHAWGKLAGGTYTGIAQDFVDFPFIQELGLSSYPYFGFNSPEEIPDDYYSRLIEGKTIPVFLEEGGWTSASVTTPDRSFTSSPEIQKDYMQKQASLLDGVNAIAWLQIVFTDIDVSSLPPATPEIIGYFAFLGMVDVDFNPKPSLTAWDSIFYNRSFRP